MTGEEGRSNPQIMVNGASIGAMERGATPIGGASASREVEKKEGKVLTQSPESHRTENHPHVVNAGEGKGELRGWS